MKDTQVNPNDCWNGVVKGSKTVCEIMCSFLYHKLNIKHVEYYTARDFFTTLIADSKNAEWIGNRDAVYVSHKLRIPNGKLNHEAIIGLEEEIAYKVGSSTKFLKLDYMFDGQEVPASSPFTRKATYINDFIGISATRYGSSDTWVICIELKFPAEYLSMHTQNFIQIINMPLDAIDKGLKRCRELREVGNSLTANS